MCGIVGMVEGSFSGFNQSDQQLFFGMLLLNSFRGIHSTGVMGLNKKGQQDIIKVLGHPYELLKWQSYGEFNKRVSNAYWALVGHGRSATQGSVIVDNAHPFMHGHISLVHNGTLLNFESLQKSMKTNFEVDSEVICYSLANNGLADTLKEIRGAYSLVWFDTKDNSLNFIRNYERPMELGLTHFQDTFYFASERNVLDWVSSKKTSKIKEIKVLPAHEHWKIIKEEARARIEITPYPQNNVKIYSSRNLASYFDGLEEESSAEDLAMAYTGSVSEKKVVVQKPGLWIAGNEAHIGDNVVFSVNDWVQIKKEHGGPASLFITGTSVLDVRVEVCHRFEGTEEDLYALFEKDDIDFKMMGKIRNYYKPTKHPDGKLYRVFVDNVEPMAAGTLLLPYNAKEKLQERQIEEQKATDAKVVAFRTTASTVSLKDDRIITIKKYNTYSSMGCFICSSKPTLSEAHKCLVVKNLENHSLDFLCPKCAAQHTFENEAIKHGAKLH